MSQPSPLARLLASARAAWPRVRLEDAVFLRYLAERLAPASVARVHPRWLPVAARACDTPDAMSLESRFRAPDGCPDENVLAGFASGALSHEDTPRLEQHLDGCAACRALVAAEASRPGDSHARAGLDTGTPTPPMHPGALPLEPGAHVGRYAGPRWLPVVTGVAGLGLVLAGADVVVWKSRTPEEVPAREAMPVALMPGTPVELEIPGMVRVAVGAPDVVEVKVLDGDKVQLLPLETGTTTMRVWTRDGTRRTYNVSVGPY
ncbi:MAG TPA: pilus assembly protein N-terminal domain-containing protein [Archangium sp.]|uniref:pilus assembly protein N-terminal domain-containing protein n=1 Tax=Archangium sp. TaxID=1872627 RepID=UPI002E30E9B5|nr:pilus assembly protein N-terminal domain-containing protein [Archangium sp.]HEX5750873.1 pilus assembly protein N-terminal domain-containing protein [Archangium sp.]